MYYARGKNDEEYAIKIFKTSILVFKDRDRYVSGEFRFRNGYCKSNPRKMVRTWAEKEMRNLKRLQNASIPCPIPYLLKSHIIIMEFLGKDGWCSPRLKEVELSQEQYSKCYIDLIIIIRRIYHECNLVHGDLSEYNILWHNETPVIIDVSQSVEHSHPFSNDFLRKDIANITDYFRKKNVFKLLSKFHLFQFITDPYLKPELKEASIEVRTESLRQYVIELIDNFDNLKSFTNSNIKDHDNSANIPPSDTLQHTVGDSYQDETQDGYEDDSCSDTSDVEEAVFLQSYIPTSLSEISNPHQEKARLDQGGREPVYAAAVQRMLTGSTSVMPHPKPPIVVPTMKVPLGSVHQAPVIEGDEAAGDCDSKNRITSEGNEDEGDGDRGDEGEVADGASDGQPSRSPSPSQESECSEGFDHDEKYHRRLPNTADPEARKLAKLKKKEACKAVKELAAAKRESKIPKHVKKRAVKVKSGAKKR